MSIKLLMLTEALDRGGAETHICSLARALVKKGHHVTVASAGGELVSLLGNGGVTHRRLPLRRKNPFSLFFARLGLRRLIKKGGFELIHAHARLPAFLVAPIAKRKGIPLVTTVHGKFRLKAFRRRFSRWGERAIAVSEDLKQYLAEEYGYLSDHIRVIPNGIDTNYFSPLSEPTASEDVFRLLFVSRLDHDCARAAFLLCRMAEKLKSDYPQLEIQIVGGGNALPELRRRADAINGRADAPFLFPMGHASDPRSFYRSAHGVIGVSRVALEAMSCGVPVILAGNEGMLGLIDEELLPLAAAGNFCCREGTPLTEDRLRYEIDRLLSLSEQKRLRLGQSLSEYVERFHSLSRIAAETEEFYADVLSIRPAKGFSDAVLCGYYGYGNMGDDALLTAAVGRAASDYPDYSLSAMTKNGKKDTARFGIRCIPRKNPFAIRRELKHAKLLVFGGGTLLQDRTSLRSLLYYAAILRYAHRRGLRIELWGNGLDVPRTLRGERIIADSLSLCHRIGLRDNPSLAWALSHAPEERAGRYVFEPDLALGIQPASPSRVAFLCRRFRVARAPSGSATHGFGIVAVRGKIGRGYLKILLSWLSTLRGERIRLLFVPMLPREDERLCRRLALMLGGQVADHLSPSDLVGLMKEARIVCGMRLHSLVFAASAETPFVGFGNDPKIEAFCREHGGVFFTDLY